MDELGAQLAALAEEAAAMATAAGTAAARRRGARRRRQQAATTMLLIAGLVAGSVWLGRWKASPERPTTPPPSTPPTTMRWYPFDPTGDPDLRPTGKPVLITQGVFAGQPLRLWAFKATLSQGKKKTPQICVAEDYPGGGGGAGCSPASEQNSGVGETAIGDQVQLLDGVVTKRASVVRLELEEAGRPLPPIVVRPLPGGPHLPVNVWVATTGRTVEIRRIVLLDAAGREIGHVAGHPETPDQLPPLGPVTVLGHAPSPSASPSGGGPLRVGAYDAEAAFTCIQVIPDQRPGNGFVKCVPPLAPRPALETYSTCSGADGFAYLYGTAPRTARMIWIEVAGGAPIRNLAFDAGAHFGRSYWATIVPNRVKVTAVLAIGDRGAVVARTTLEPRIARPSC